MQRKMDAGASVEDLRARCPHFYDVALKLHEVSNNEQLSKFAISCFRARYKVCEISYQSQKLLDYILKDSVQNTKIIETKKQSIIRVEQSHFSCKSRFGD